jgi:hypothetical protein
MATDKEVTSVVHNECLLYSFGDFYEDDMSTFYLRTLIFCGRTVPTVCTTSVWPDCSDCLYNVSRARLFRLSVQLLPGQTVPTVYTTSPGPDCWQYSTLLCFSQSTESF